MSLTVVIVLVLWLISLALYIRAAIFGVAIIYRSYKEKRLGVLDTILIMPLLILGAINGSHSALVFWQDVFGV